MSRLFWVEGPCFSIICCHCWFELRNEFNQIIAAVIWGLEVSGRYLSPLKRRGRKLKFESERRVFSGCDGLIVCTDELYPSTHQRLKEIPLKDPLSFKQPRTSRAAFIFKAYPVTKDTSAPRLHYMWSGCKLADVSASLCPSAIHAV